MSDQTKLLLTLLEQGKSCNEICDILHISNRQLYNNLTNIKNKGFLFSRKYTSKGDILYQTTNYISEEDNTIKLDEQYIKILVISDLHFGNEKENLDRINNVFDYCIKNNIHTIFCCGDFIDGTYSQGIQTIKNFYEQVDYFIKKYPFDKNILTFGVGGDHDLSGITHCGQNFLEAIYNYRHDCIIPSFNNSVVNIKNINILLHHRNPKDDIPNNFNINLFGHSHKFAVRHDENGNFMVKVPSISDINVYQYNVLPSALELELTFEKDILKLIQFNHLYFGDKNYLLSELSYEIPSSKKKKIEDYETDAKGSQVEKFVKRLNKAK